MSLDCLYGKLFLVFLSTYFDLSLVTNERLNEYTNFLIYVNIMWFLKKNMLIILLYGNLCIPLHSQFRNELINNIAEWSSW